MILQTKNKTWHQRMKQINTWLQINQQSQDNSKMSNEDVTVKEEYPEQNTAR